MCVVIISQNDFINKSCFDMFTTNGCYYSNQHEQMCQRHLSIRKSFIFELILRQVMFSTTGKLKTTSKLSLNICGALSLARFAGRREAHRNKCSKKDHVFTPHGYQHLFHDEQHVDARLEQTIKLCACAHLHKGNCFLSRFSQLA